MPNCKNQIKGKDKILKMHNDTAKLRLNSEIYKFRYELHVAFKSRSKKAQPHQKNHTRFQPTKPLTFDYPRRKTYDKQKLKHSNVVK